jgi:hypothetical protein
MLLLWEKDLKKHYKAFNNIFCPLHLQLLLLMILKKWTKLKRKLQKHNLINLLKLNNQQTFCQNQFKEGSLRLNLIHLTYLLLYPPKHNPSVWWDARGRDNGGGWFTHHNDSKVSTCWRERNPKDVTMDLDGI